MRRLKTDQFFRGALLAIVASPFVLGLADSRAAHAGVYLEVTGFPSYKTDNTFYNSLGGAVDSSALNTDSGFSYDLRNVVGYVIAHRFLIAANYNYAYSPTKMDATSTTASLDKYFKTSEWGGSIGWFGGHFRLIGSYLFAGTKEYKDYEINPDGSGLVDTTIKNTGGSGYQFILGYSFPITKAFLLGPTLVYRHMSYSKQTYTNNLNATSNYTDAEFTTKAVETTLTPMITLAFHF